MNEQQFEECSLEDATHVEVNGVRHELNDNVQYFCNGDLLGIRWRDEYTFIPEELFSTLGIQPLKEVNPEPIGFEATFVKYDGEWHTLFSLHGLKHVGCREAKFKCVQILEEKK